MNSTLITSLPIENNSNSSCRVKIEFSENCFFIIIFYNDIAYKGEMTAEYISNQSKIFNLSVSEYLKECRKAFQNLIPRQFTFSIVDDHFHIKKSVAMNSAKSINVKFASMKLIEVDFQESILGVLDIALSENNQFVMKVVELQSANEALKEGNKLLLEQLKRLQSAKNEMENVVYFRFLNLLNSKKKKIKELKRNSAIEMEEDTASEIEEEMPLKTHAPDVYDVDTDVDEDIEVEVVKNECKPEQSSSKNETIRENPVELAKNQLSIKEFLKSNENLGDEAKRPKATSIFDQMSILDPTIPFVG